MSASIGLVFLIRNAIVKMFLNKTGRKNKLRKFAFLERSKPNCIEKIISKGLTDSNIILLGVYLSD